MRVSVSYTHLQGSKGGRPEKLYHLNEQQATLLITYLKNTEPVRKFKKALVRGFFKARQELARREAQRAVKVPVRRSLTDAIRDSGEAERMKGYAYNSYTNLIYKTVTAVSYTHLDVYKRQVIWYNNPQSCRLRGCACAPHTLLCWRTGL